MTDFFAEGVEEGVIFRKEQEDFFRARLAVLDPKKIEQVQIGIAYSLLKYSGLKQPMLQKIFKNCQIKAGTKAISYYDMKKLFRAVALAQNKIEPSSININANIKTKLPILDDDEDQDDTQQQQKHQQNTKQNLRSQNPHIQKSSQQPQPYPPHPQENKQTQYRPSATTAPPIQKTKNSQQSNFPQFSPNTKAAANFAQFGNFGKITSKDKPKPTQRLNKSDVEHRATVNIQMENSHQNLGHNDNKHKFESFEKFWKGLKTKDGKIDGSEVKKACKKIENREALSKAWKLCNLTIKGGLTKGEFYVFMNLVVRNKLPNTLSEEMKDTILKLDNKISPTKQVLATSTVFQNPQFFRKSKEQDKGTSPSFTGFRDSRAQNQDKTEQICGQIIRDQYQANQNIEGLKVFAEEAERKANGVQCTVETIRKTQQQLNARTNIVLLAMRTIITKQSEIIQELMGQIKQQNSQNEQRLAILQNYTKQTDQFITYKLSVAAKAHAANSRDQTKKAFDKVEDSFKDIAIKHGNPQARQEINETNEVQYEPPQQIQKKYQQPDQPRNEVPTNQMQQRQEMADQQQRIPTKANQTHSKAISQQGAQNQRRKQSEYNAVQDNLEQQISLRKMNLIKMLHYVSPIKQSEYPYVLNRINNMSQKQMQILQSKLNEMFIAKEKANQPSKPQND